MFVSGAELATEAPYGIIILQRYVAQKVVQFLKAVAYLRRVGFMGFCVSLVQLVEDGFAIAVTGVKGVGVYVGVEPLCNLIHISTPLRQ